MEPNHDFEIDLLPPAELGWSMPRRLLLNVREAVAPEKLPPLQLTSRPVNLGMILGDRLALPWYRSVFTNLGDVISPEVLPPLESQSPPVDVGELLGDELQKPWWSSLIRNLADKVAPERLPALALTSTPVQPDSASSWLYAPRWSELLTGPKIFYPDKPKEARASIPSPRIVVAAPVRPRNIDPETMREVREVMKERRRSLRWAHMREGLWIACAVAEVVLIVFYSVK